LCCAYITIINFGRAAWFSQPLHLLYYLPIGLHIFNAYYYCDKVVGNYHVKFNETKNNRRKKDGDNDKED
jgi:hypothetical protein